MKLLFVYCLIAFTEARSLTVPEEDTNPLNNLEQNVFIGFAKAQQYVIQMYFEDESHTPQDYAAYITKRFNDLYNIAIDPNTNFAENAKKEDIDVMIQTETSPDDFYILLKAFHCLYEMKHNPNMTDEMLLFNKKMDSLNSTSTTE